MEPFQGLFDGMGLFVVAIDNDFAVNIGYFDNGFKIIAIDKIS